MRSMPSVSFGKVGSTGRCFIFCTMMTLLSVSAQQALCGQDAQQASCSACVAINQPGNYVCLWNQLPSSTAAPGGAGGASCVSQTTFYINKQASPFNAGYGYCPASTGCDGYDAVACFADSTCDWITNIANILDRSYCNVGFCALQTSGALVAPVNMTGVKASFAGSGVTLTCVVVTKGGLTPLAIGLIVAGAIIVLAVLPLIICRTGLFSKRSNLIAGEPSMMPKTPTTAKLSV